MCKFTVTDVSRARVVVEGIDGERQTVDVEKGSLIQGPVQAIGDVHLRVRRGQTGEYRKGTDRQVAHKQTDR